MQAYELCQSRALAEDTCARPGRSDVKETPLMEAVDEFIEGAQPFPETQVSMLAHAA